MRKLMWFAVGFAGACWLCVFLPEEDSWRYPAVFALLAALAVGLIAGSHAPARIAAAVLLGCSGGFFWYPLYSANYLAPASALDGVTRQAVITAADYSFETGYGWAVDGRIFLDGNPYQVRTYLEEGENITPGVIIEGTFRFRLTTPDGKQGATSHSGKGIFLLAYQEGETVLSAGEEETFSMWASRLRRQLKDILKQCLPEDGYPFAIALLLGDTGELSYEMDTRLKVSGIRHVAAVSGLHVSILFALVSGVTLRKRWLKALAGLPVLLAFAGLSGFTPSVNRACIMCALMLLASLVNREYDGATALAFSVLVMLMVNPMTISAVSFQLSVVSVAGIFLFSQPIAHWLSRVLGKPKGKRLSARLKRWFLSSVATTLSAMSLTTPLCAWYFGTVSLIGVVTNLLTLWVISFIFYGLMGVCLLFPFSTAGALAMGWVTAWPIRYVLAVARVLASVPIACVYTASDYIVLWLVFAYVLLAVFLVSHRERPTVLAYGAALGLCLALVCSWAEPLLHDTSVTVLDVGQGQCILLQSEGKNYLVDCGGEDDALAADTAAGALLSQGIARLDGLILTHMDRDHMGGAENLLRRVPADVVILPAVHYALDTGEARKIYADRSMEICWGSTRLHIYGEKMQASGNENSLCILLDTEKCDILITGDRDAAGEARLLRTVALPQVDVLVAGHHGSKNASSEALLQKVRPEIVCISVGEENIYGHPAAQTLQRLYQFGCRVYRTDIHGTITIRR